MSDERCYIEILNHIATFYDDYVQLDGHLEDLQDDGFRIDITHGNQDSFSWRSKDLQVLEVDPESVVNLHPVQDLLHNTPWVLTDDGRLRILIEVRDLLDGFPSVTRLGHGTLLHNTWIRERRSARLVNTSVERQLSLQELSDIFTAKSHHAK